MTREEFHELLQDLIQDLRDMDDPVSSGISEALSEMEDPTRAEVDKVLRDIVTAVQHLRGQVQNMR